MTEYSFFTLSLILAIPGAVVFASRRDLRPMIGWLSLASIPFAWTELLFYPDYWKPRFLFDLIDVLGFGIEDVMFVVGLAAFASTSWAFVSRQTLEPLARAQDVSARVKLARALGLLALCFGCVGGFWAADVAMIYAAPVIMFALGAVILAMRPDLWRAAFGGALITTLVYSGVCLLLAAIIPQVFQLDWNTEKFLNIFILGIPLEEVLYAAASGFIATLFYPWATSQRYVPLSSEGERA